MSQFVTLQNDYIQYIYISSDTNKYAKYMQWEVEVQYVN